MCLLWHQHTRSHREDDLWMDQHAPFKPHSWLHIRDTSSEEITRHNQLVQDFNSIRLACSWTFTRFTGKQKGVWAVKGATAVLPIILSFKMSNMLLLLLLPLEHSGTWDYCSNLSLTWRALLIACFWLVIASQWIRTEWTARQTVLRMQNHLYCKIPLRYPFIRKKRAINSRIPDNCKEKWSIDIIPIC